MGKQAIKPFSFDPAALRHRIILSRPNENIAEPWQDPTGPVEFANLWAGILDVDARSSTEADQTANSETFAFVIRYRIDLTAATNLQYDGKSFDLLSMHDPDQRKQWLILNARSTIGHG